MNCILIFNYPLETQFIPKQKIFLINQGINTSLYIAVDRKASLSIIISERSMKYNVSY